MKKTILLISIIFISFTIILSLFFTKKAAKIFKSGNTKTSQEIVDYILNISSYEVTVNVEVISNKNQNKYILKQTYKEPNISTQEVIEPSNIAGIKLTNNGSSLTLENSRLNLSTVFENYNYLGDNCLDLTEFIKDYKESDESIFEEDENQVIMKTDSGASNNYIKHKILYIDKETYNPTKMEIKDNNQKTTVYILYNEVKIDSTKLNNELANKKVNI